MKKQKAVILSAQFPGFMNLVEGLSSEEISKLMNSINDLVESSFKIHGGKINQYSGEKLLVVFENPGSKPSVPARAVDAIIELKDRIVSFTDDETNYDSLKLNTGIATGEVIIGELGSQQTLMGKAVNHANRICEFAREGQILVDSQIQEATNEFFEFQSLEPIPIKGTDETLPIFELTGKKRRKLNLKVKSERKIVSEMVGRNREAEQLEGLVKNLIAGKGAVVNIVGKAGIGKSRFMAEMMVQDDIAKNIIVLEGRAMSTGQNLSFHPIINLLKSWANISEDDAQKVSSEKLYKGIKQIDHSRADEIFVFMATMMGLPLEGKFKERVQGIEGDALEKLILKNLRDLIITASKQKPRIYLIEDMHWADSSSITIFESLYKLTQNHPVMFINVMRTGYKETGDYILKYLVDNFPDDHVTIVVPPLDKSNSVELIINLLRKTRLPTDVEKMIIKKTEGNPFFIEEVIRSFIDDGIIEIKDKEFKVTEKINGVNIPETINEAILSRVDKLDEKTRELLNTASVIGRNFYYKVLEEVTDTIGELDDRLQYLKEVQLINESEKKEEIEYLFKHALAQQVTYESIINESKKGLHLKIAKSIEKVFSENLNEFYGILAHHYEKAGNHEKMEEYLVKAGDEAMKTGASKEAIHYYNKVLVAIVSSSDDANKQKTIYLEEKLAYAHYALGKNKKAAEYFNMVTPSYGFTKVPDNKLAFIFKLLYSLVLMYIKVRFGKKDINYKATTKDEQMTKLLMYQGEAIASFDPRHSVLQFQILGASVPLHIFINTYHGLGALINYTITFPWTGRLLWYGETIKKFLLQVMDKNNRLVYFAFLYYEAMANYLTGKLLMDNSEDDEIFKYGMAMGLVWAPTVHHAFKGIGYVELGNKEEALKLTENLFTLATELEHSFSLMQYYRLKITYLLKFRKLDELITEADTVISTIEKTDHSSMLVLAQNIISMAYSLNNNPEEARKHNEIAIVLAKKLWLKYYASMTDLSSVHLQLAEIRLKGDNPSKSEISELIKKTKQLVSNSKNVHCNKTEAFRMRAIAFKYAGKNSHTIKYFKKSIDFAEWYGAKLELSRTYFETGKFLSDPQTRQNQLNGLSGKDYLEKAKVLFEEMDLQWDLEEYRKYEEGL